MLRFALSPTSDMHIGDLRVAILNYLVSQQKNDQFLVRIEDTDAKYNIEGKDTEIMMTLEKFALKHTSVFHQSEHLNLYQTLALRLLKEKKAFVCKCSKLEINSCLCSNLKQENHAELKTSGKKFVIRINKPKDDSSSIDAFIIIENDGIPSYDFACATDDMMSNIDCVIRPEKYLLNTPKQIHIKKLLGYENKTNYIHIPIILNTEKITVKQLFQEGFIPDAILNYLLLLGYSKAPKEIFTLPQAIEWFNLNNMLKSAVKFDMEKLRFINREHLKLMEDKQLSTLFGFADADIGKLAKIYLEECSTTNELETKIRSIFTAKNFNKKWGEQMKILSDLIFNAPTFENFNEFKNHITKESGLDTNVDKPLRYLLTGLGNGPELDRIYPFIKSYILEIAS